MKFMYSDLFGLFTKSTSKPEIQPSKTTQLLLRARRDFKQLKETNRQLISAGLLVSETPDEPQLLALSYMGDYQRDTQVRQAKGIDTALLRQLTGTNRTEEICTPVLRLLNAMTPLLAKLKTLHEQFVMGYDALAELQLLNDGEVFCADSIRRSSWGSGKQCLKAEVGKNVSHLYMAFNRFAHQTPQLHSINHDKHLSNPTDWISEPFYLDEGNLILLAKVGDQIKFKNIPMRLTNELPRDRFSLC